MSKHKDLMGMVFGLWKVLERGPNSKEGGAQWFCRCSCGKVRTVPTRALMSGRSKSCGKHGHAVGSAESKRPACRKSITKCLVQCPTCGKIREVLEATRDAFDFNPQCLGCNRIAKNKAKAAMNLRPTRKRNCLKCGGLFQPTVGRWFLCERCFEQNMNPSEFQSCASDDWAAMW